MLYDLSNNRHGNFVGILCADIKANRPTNEIQRARGRGRLAERIKASLMRCTTAERADIIRPENLAPREECRAPTHVHETT